MKYRKLKNWLRSLEQAHTLQNAKALPSIEFDTEAQEMARQIVDSGYGEFIGPKIPTLAMATQWEYAPAKRLEDRTILRRVPCGYSQSKEHVASLEPHIRDKQAPIAPARDTAIAPIAQTGAPGSKARIEALAEHYAQHETTEGIKGQERVTGQTAFAIDDDGLASALAAALSRNPANRAEFISAIQENRPIRPLGAGAPDGTLGVSNEGTTETEG